MVKKTVTLVGPLYQLAPPAALGGGFWGLRAKMSWKLINGESNIDGQSVPWAVNARQTPSISTPV